MKKAIEAFKRKDLSKEEIVIFGKTVLLHMYNAPKNVDSIDKLRFVIFSKAVASRNIRKKAVNLASLPPTMNAAQYHLFRVYLQTQQWLSVDLNPQEWGWSFNGHILTPITMTAMPAPDNILKMIFCSCQNICKSTCSCRKAGLYCSTICRNCQTAPCTNEPKNVDDDELEEVEEQAQEEWGEELEIEEI